MSGAFFVPAPTRRVGLDCEAQDKGGCLKATGCSGLSGTRSLLEAAVRAVVGRKPQRHEFCEMPQKIVRVMSATGG